MKKRLFIVAAALSLFMSSCTIKESSYVNNNDLVTIAVEESPNYVINSENPLNVARGEDAIFNITFNGDYDFKSSSDGSYDFKSGILTISGVQYSKTIYVNTVEMITILLEVTADSHFIVTSENPIRIEKGNTAIFDVEIEEGYVFEESDNYRFENGKLIFPNLKYSTNLRVHTIERDIVFVEIINDDSLGTVSISPNQPRYYLGDIITISIVPITGVTFICFSENKSIHEPNNSGKPISFKSFYTFEIKRNITLVANYYNHDDFLMEYDLNGGKTFEEEESLTFDYRLFGKRIRPNSLLNDSYFYKDGFFLESYNTESDGSGTRIGIGSRIDVELFENKRIKLYCQWLKESNISDFVYQINDNKIEITKYLGNDSEVIIPKIIEGMEVVIIKTNAFESSMLQSVYIPDSIVTIEEQSFLNCNKLEKILYWTSLESISDRTFKGCNNLKTIAINYSTYPKYLKSFGRGNYADKLDNAEVLAKKGPTILAVGSSTLQYNHDFKTMENALNNEYSCYNLAGLFAMPLQLMYDFSLSIAGSDDLVLIQLHEKQAARTAPIGNIAFAYLEGDFDRLLLINYQNHKKYLLDSWSSYKQTARTLDDEMSYEYYDYSLKDCGDYVWSSREDMITDDNKGSGILTISTSYTYDNFSYLVDLREYHANKKTLLVFDTYNKNAIENMDTFYAFENLIISNLKERFSIMGTIDNSIIEGKYFRYQDNIHLNMDGGKKRCLFFAEEVIKYINDN